jgi:hypothetical protein
MIAAQGNEVIIIKSLAVILGKRYYVMYRQFSGIILQNCVVLLCQTYPAQVHIPCLDIFGLLPPDGSITEFIRL